MRNKIIFTVFTVTVVIDIILWSTQFLSQDIALQLLLALALLFYVVMKCLNRKDDIYNGKFDEHFK